MRENAIAIACNVPAIVDSDCGISTGCHVLFPVTAFSVFINIQYFALIA